MPVTTFRNLTISYHDEDEYKTLIEEIFKRNSYYVEFETDAPFIIDAGAHIGMTTLYFKSLYPKARITSIEPNAQNLRYIQKNLEENNIENVTVVPKALVGKKETREFLPLYTDNKWTALSSLKPGGWTGTKPGGPEQVETVKLSTLITEPVDLLKVDIEGLECEVLEEVGEKLRMVKLLMCEFHKTPKHTEDKLLRILKQYFKTVTATRDIRKRGHRGNELIFIEAKK